MAAGSFIFENKIRPGSYIQMKGVQSASNMMSERGTVVIIDAFDSGNLITELSADEILSGDSKYKGFPSEMFTSVRGVLPYVYPYVNKIIIGRTNTTESVKATTVVKDDSVVKKDMTVTANFAGKEGNKLSVIISSKSGKYEVKTSINGVVFDSQLVSDCDDLVSNSQVTFDVPVGFGVPAFGTLDLMGGTSGESSLTDITSILSGIRDLHWNTLGYCLSAKMPDGNNTPIKDENVGVILAFIQSMREDSGKYRQAVVFCDVAEESSFSNYEGVIVIEQVFEIKNPLNVNKLWTLSPAESVGFVAALTAGSDVGVSNTYKQLPSSVIKVSPAINTNEAVEAEIAKGRLIFTTRSDGKLVIEQDINSLHEFTASRTYPFSKNRCIRALDEISNTKVLVWEKLYCGKINNDETGRSMFKSEIIRILNDIKSVGGIQPFATDDIKVEQGAKINEVRSYERITPVDSMEILYSYVTVVG